MLTSQSKRMVMVSFLSSLFPPIQHFFSQLFFQLNYYPFGQLAAFPQSTSQISAPTAITCLRVAWRRQWRWVLLSFLFPPFDTFLKPNLITIPSAAQAALPQSIEGTRACYHHPHPWGVWRRWWHWVSLLFFFTISNDFSQYFFQWNCYLGGGWLGFAVFHFHPPPHLIFTMSHVSIKICLPKLPFCVVN